VVGAIRFSLEADGNPVESRGLARIVDQARAQIGLRAPADDA
jgi:hypothetical protein